MTVVSVGRAGRMGLVVLAVAGTLLAGILGVWPPTGWSDRSVSPFGAAAWLSAGWGSLVGATSGPARGPVASRGAQWELGEVTLLAIPERAAVHAVVLRDGLPVSAFDGGPVTVVVAGGDQLAVRSDGRRGLRVRVLGVSSDVVWPRLEATVPLGPGRTALGRVRLASAG